MTLHLLPVSVLTLAVVEQPIEKISNKQYFFGGLSDYHTKLKESQKQPDTELSGNASKSFQIFFPSLFPIQ